MIERRRGGVLTGCELVFIFDFELRQRAGDGAIADQRVLYPFGAQQPLLSAQAKSELHQKIFRHHFALVPVCAKDTREQRRGPFVRRLGSCSAPDILNAPCLESRFLESLVLGHLRPANYLRPHIPEDFDPAQFELKISGSER
jgi:hypothetical protein